MPETFFVWTANHDDHTHSKLAETYSSTFTENTPIREGGNLLLRMCTLDAAKTRRPLFYGETNDIVVFGKMLNILWYTVSEENDT